MSNEIRFYSRSKKYFEFSNFSNNGFTIHNEFTGNLFYPTVEHYFQSLKFLDHSYSEKVRTASTPGEAKRLGKSRQYPIRNDWDDTRLYVMMTAVEAKFSQNPELEKMLVDTGDAVLIEDSPYDYFWGAGKNNTGQNMLGKLLMNYRDKLNRL
ncbi:NADAR family protein [Virgibacillus salexigens]|uniref:Swarming motility protein YbiA n=1 Tax=Virgibacillus massiliensis TaxID=1462526 RepID=A0A024QH81_9BACI|nr:NADAR family protein [Virgibacillus massiliensis]CDQ41859.1 Swarming motility protein YbiA [Virgibacillus massiliensis]